MHFFTEYTHIFLEVSLNCCATAMLSHYPHLRSVLDLRICIFSIGESRSIPEVAGDSNFVQFGVSCTNGSQIVSATDGTGTERSTEPLEHPGTLILHQEILEVSSLQNYFSKKRHAQCSLACCKILAYFISTSSWVNEKSHFMQQAIPLQKNCLSLGVNSSQFRLIKYVGPQKRNSCLNH